MGKTLEQLLDEAQQWVESATPAQLKVMRDRQRESWARAMTTPCEHGVLDFEQCAECRTPTTPENGNG